MNYIIFSHKIKYDSNYKLFQYFFIIKYVPIFIIRYALLVLIILLSIQVRSVYRDYNTYQFFSYQTRFDYLLGLVSLFVHWTL